MKSSLRLLPYAHWDTVQGWQTTPAGHILTSIGDIMLTRQKDSEEDLSQEQEMQPSRVRGLAHCSILKP